MRRFEGRTVGLHRWIIEQVDGPLAPGAVVMHLCDNPPCFRYDHLRVGTSADNNRDAVAKGRRANQYSPGPRAVYLARKVRTKGVHPVGRPSKGDRVRTAIRLPRPVYDAAVAAAALAGVSLNDWIGDATAARLGLPAAPHPAREVADVPIDQPPPAAPLAVQAAVCPHPRSERRVLGWGTTCGACGTVL